MLELVAQIQEAIEVAYHNVVALVGAGYVTYEPFPLNVDDPTAPRLQHWINPWRMGDGRNLDPWRPESVRRRSRCCASRIRTPGSS